MTVSARGAIYPGLAMVAVLILAAGWFDPNRMMLANHDADLWNYLQQFTDARYTSLPKYLGTTGDKLYDLLVWLFARGGASFYAYLMILQLALVLSYAALAYAVTRSLWLAVACSLMFVTVPLFFEALAAVAVRQGLATTLVLASVSFIITGRHWWAVVTMLLAVFVHQTAVFAALVIVAALLSQRHPRLLLTATVASMAVYAINVTPDLTQWVLGIVRQATGREIMSALFAVDYPLGFKVNYFLLASVQVATAGYLILVSASRTERFVAAISLVGTALYLCTSGIPFYNRIALWVWVFLPVLAVLAAQVFARRQWGLLLGLRSNA